MNQTGEIRFRINDQDIFLDISESYIEFEGQLTKLDGTEYASADKATLINNALMQLFSSINYRLSGQEIEQLIYPGESTTMMGYLKYSEDFEKTEGLNQLWCKERAAYVGKNGFNIRHNYIIDKPQKKGTFSFAVPLKHILVSVKVMKKLCMVSIMSYHYIEMLLKTKMR